MRLATKCDDSITASGTRWLMNRKRRRISGVAPEKRRIMPPMNVVSAKSAGAAPGAHPLASRPNRASRELPRESSFAASNREGDRERERGNR